jgi:hypothetical protein
MDPNQTLADLRTALAHDFRVGAYSHAADLADWIQRGGFQPSDPTWRDELVGLGIAVPA